MPDIILTKGLRLNAVTGHKVHAPSVSPDTLRELINPYYGFLQTYSLEGDTITWHGQLLNIGLQYPRPNSIILPPSVTEMLRLNNTDSLILKPSPLSEARTITYKVLPVNENQTSNLSKLLFGMQVGLETQYNYNDMAIELVSWEPEGCYLGSNTKLIVYNGENRICYTPESQACDVVTDVCDQDNNNLTQEKND